MNEFLLTALTFPTVVPGALLDVCVLYWLLAATGLVDGDAPDALLGGEGDAGDLTGAAAMLSKIGLAGVPLMVAFTVLCFTAWLGTYFAQLLVLRHLPEGVRTVAGAATLLAMLVPAVATTSLLLRPVGRGLARLRPAEPSLLGRTGVVVTSAVSGDFGRVAMDDGGAGLVLQVRHDDAHPLARGERVVLMEYLDGEHAYRVHGSGAGHDRGHGRRPESSRGEWLRRERYGGGRFRGSGGRGVRAGRGGRSVGGGGGGRPAARPPHYPR